MIPILSTLYVSEKHICTTKTVLGHRFAVNELVYCFTVTYCGIPSIQKKPIISKEVPVVEDGVDSMEGMWPWQLAVEAEVFGVFTYRCGASLITPEWAITSASCVNTSGPFRLVAGEYSLAESSGNENYRVFTATDVTMVGTAHIKLIDNFL